MFTSRVVKLDPTPQQEKQFLSNCGGARFAYNTALAHVMDCLDRKEKINLSHYGLRKWWNQNKDELAPWWAENSKEAYSNSISDLATGLRNCFNKNRKKRAGFPRFKKRGSKDSFRVTCGFRISGRTHIHIPRCGKVHTPWNH